MVTRLTRRQQRVLGVIERLTAEQGFPPTVRELARALKIASPNGLRHHLKALEQKGYISRRPRIARSIRVLANC